MCANGPDGRKDEKQDSVNHLQKLPGLQSVQDDNNNKCVRNLN
jgi:hypothetical protein